MRKITLHSGTTLAQQRQQPCADAPSDDGSDHHPGHHEGDEDRAMSHAEHLHGELGAGSRANVPEFATNYYKA